MSNTLKINDAIDKAVRDAEGQNAATVEADTEKLEAAITHTAASWSVAGYVRKLWRGPWIAGGRAEKRW